MELTRLLKVALPVLALALAGCDGTSGTAHGGAVQSSSSGGGSSGAGGSTSTGGSSSTGSGLRSGSTGGSSGTTSSSKSSSSTGGFGGTTTSGSSAGGSGGTTTSSTPADPVCPCYEGDGAYCGSGVGSYASQNACTVPALASNSGNIYACSSGSWSVQTQCSAGCTVEPSGTPDQCTAGCNGLSLSGFISKFTGVCTGYPGWSPSDQCTDLALQWVANLCLSVQFKGNAVNWAGESVQGFTWVQNGPGLVPSPGDVVIFGPVGMTCDDGVGVNGHVDICVSASAASYQWKGFDQNWQTDWNGACYPPQQVDHNWGECVIGWQHLTIPIP